MDDISVIRLTSINLERHHVLGIEGLWMLDANHKPLDTDAIRTVVATQYVFVAQVGQQVVGMVIFTWREHLQRRIGEFYGLAVDEKFRRRGIATRLVKKCNEEGIQLRLDALEGSCNPHDKPMRRLVKKLQFGGKTEFLFARPPGRSYEKPPQE